MQLIRIVQTLPVSPVKKFFPTHQTSMVHLSGLKQSQKKLGRHIDGVY